MTPEPEQQSRLDMAHTKLKEAQLSDEVVQEVQAQIEADAKEKARAILGEINQILG